MDRVYNRKYNYASYKCLKFLHNVFSLGIKIDKNVIESPYTNHTVRTIKIDIQVVASTS